MFTGLFFVVLALLVSVARCAATEPAPPSGQHVFFIVIDTLRADHLGSYGYSRATSPTIDRLAKDGVVFENAFANASSTLESVYSFFTSTTAMNELVYVEGYIQRHPRTGTLPDVRAWQLHRWCALAPC